MGVAPGFHSLNAPATQTDCAAASSNSNRMAGRLGWRAGSDLRFLETVFLMVFTGYLSKMATQATIPSRRAVRKAPKRDRSVTSRSEQRKPLMEPEGGAGPSAMDRRISRPGGSECVNSLLENGTSYVLLINIPCEAHGKNWLTLLSRWCLMRWGLILSFDTGAYNDSFVSHYVPVGTVG